MLNTQLTGITAASRDLSTISNNLANALTTGFKRSTAQFTEVVAQSLDARPGTEGGVGALTQQVGRSLQQGTLTSTDSALDIAINGDGFFTFREAQTEGDPSYVYSRSGKLTLNRSGELVDPAGRPLMGLAVTATGSVGTNPAPIDIQRAAGGDLNNIRGISIDTKGIVSVQRGDGSIVRAGAVALAHFTNPQGLKSASGAVMTETERSGTAEFSRPGLNGLGQVQQGSLEESNVDLTNEMLRMVQAQQAYNGNARALQTGSEMLRSAIETLTR